MIKNLTNECRKSLDSVKEGSDRTARREEIASGGVAGRSAHTRPLQAKGSARTYIKPLTKRTRYWRIQNFPNVSQTPSHVRVEPAYDRNTGSAVRKKRGGALDPLLTPS
eukprot:1194715-Prorocentrum_minimum.AAC.7